MLASELLFVYVETPLHVGTGRGLGGIDLPIQRERITAYPMVHGSSLKGRLRSTMAEARRKGPAASRCACPSAAAGAAEPPGGQGTEADGEPLEVVVIFGPRHERASDHAGALSVGDARLLLLPVRSLNGVFAWVTSRHVLRRLWRDMSAVEQHDTGLREPANKLEGILGRLGPDMDDPAGPGPAAEPPALVRPGSPLCLVDDSLVLEEFAFQAQLDSSMGELGEWMAAHALPASSEYEYWRSQLPGRLVVLPENDFRDFCQFGTEVDTRVRLDPDTKTVANGALWTEEALPCESLLYAALYASPGRAPETPAELGTGQGVLAALRSCCSGRTFLGGDETVGRGLVFLRFAGAPTEQVSRTRARGGGEAHA